MMKTNLRHLVLFFALSALSILNATGTATAQVGEQPRSELEKDIAFIRGLVADLRFIDLARKEVANLRKKHTGRVEFRRIVQLGIEVDLEGARRLPDRDERRRLYKRALDELDDFFERYAGEADAMHWARKTVVDACVGFGAFLTEELDSARDEAPEKVTGLEERASHVLRKGVAACKAFMKDLRKIGRQHASAAT